MTQPETTASGPGWEVTTVLRGMRSLVERHYGKCTCSYCSQIRWPVAVWLAKRWLCLCVAPTLRIADLGLGEPSDSFESGVPACEVEGVEPVRELREQAQAPGTSCTTQAARISRFPRQFRCGHVVRPVASRPDPALVVTEMMRVARPES